MATKITVGTASVYLGFSDEALPPNALPTPVPDGSLYVFLDRPQIWIARNNVWSYLMPISFTLTAPLGGPSDSAPIPALGSTGSTVNRQVVALGSNIDQQPPMIEQLLLRLEEDMQAIVAELRIHTIFLQGLNQLPVTEDPDTFRREMLAADETITR